MSENFIEARRDKAMPLAVASRADGPVSKSEISWFGRTMPVTQGTRVGPFEILIGAGGMGEVYRARDTRLHRDVAVKVLPQSYAIDVETGRRRLEKEYVPADRAGLLPGSLLPSADGRVYVLQYARHLSEPYPMDPP